MSKSNECINYLESAIDCTGPNISRKKCNEYFYFDKHDKKFKKCRNPAFASKSKNCRDPFNDPEPRRGTSICKDQDDAKKRKEQHEKEIAEYMETKRLETIRQQELREENAKNERKQHVESINKKNVIKLSEESAKIYIETGKQDKEFRKALDKYLQKVVPKNRPGESGQYITINPSPPSSGNSHIQPPPRPPIPDPPLSEDEQTEVGEFRPRPYAAGGKKKRKSRKSRKVRKSRKPRKSKRNRRKSTRNKKAGRWVVMPRQPGDPPTYIRMQWIDEYTTDDEEE